MEVLVLEDEELSEFWIDRREVFVMMMMMMISEGASNSPRPVLMSATPGKERNC